MVSAFQSSVLQSNQLRGCLLEASQHRLGPVTTTKPSGKAVPPLHPCSTTCRRCSTISIWQCVFAEKCFVSVVRSKLALKQHPPPPRPPTPLCPAHLSAYRCTASCCNTVLWSSPCQLTRPSWTSPAWGLAVTALKPSSWLRRCAQRFILPLGALRVQVGTCFWHVLLWTGCVEVNLLGGFWEGDQNMMAAVKMY